MAPLSLKIIMDDGVVTRKMKFDSNMLVSDALAAVEEKMMTTQSGKVYGLFLSSTQDSRTGTWLESQKTLDFYILKDGDVLHYLCRTQVLRVRLVDGSVKTLQVDQAMPVCELMVGICKKLGIVNHEEYSLCRENDNEPENVKSSMIGTLTLKKKSMIREKDAKLEQLSKKLKTDDNVNWLDQNQTLRELQVNPSETLLLKRKLFFSDRKIDARDPVQLNLLYVQCRDAILDERHPVTADQAVAFAGIQCQVQYGDFQEDKHKPGFIEDLRELLPPIYVSCWGAEKKILKAYQKHHGLTESEAKHLYVKTARELPTYGVTFFLVKEKQKGVKKLVPRLLGISCEKILRMDEETKEVLQSWNLNQVRSYKVGATETFTLDFGDYSEKEYTVKTNEGLRIRDILQGYIDIIGKRALASPWAAKSNTGSQIEEDKVELDRVQFIQDTDNNATKVVEESFVGPSRIITSEEGIPISQGTQITTVNQLVIMDKKGAYQMSVKGGAPARKDMSRQFVRKLNSLNSNSVEIVTLLTDPTEENIAKVKKIVEDMEIMMPEVLAGVREIAAKQTDEHAKSKLLSELQDLSGLLDTLVTSSRRDPFNNIEVEEAAKNLADLSTQIYFSLDPGTKRRSQLVRQSRNSFIEDEKTLSTLHRASFVASSAMACQTINNAKEKLSVEYRGPELDENSKIMLEYSAADKIGKLNAAMARFIGAHQQPDNIDYTAALQAMNTINELFKDLVEEINALSSAEDKKSKHKMLHELQELCVDAQELCNLSANPELEKLQDAGKKYAESSNKLLYCFKRRIDPAKENEIIDLAKDVCNKASKLLVKANELTMYAETEPGAVKLDDAGVRCAMSARSLLVVAELTAPALGEPHCQSALTAACEDLASSAQSVALAAKPLIEDPMRRHFAEDLNQNGLELARALDALRDAYSTLKPFEEYSKKNLIPEKRTEPLKFIMTKTAAQKKIQDVKNMIDQPSGRLTTSDDDMDTKRERLSRNLARLNAALAALTLATSDRENVDYEAAEEAIKTISSLTSEIVEDTKAVNSGYADEVQKFNLDQVRAMCDAFKGICEYSTDEHNNLNDAVNECAKASEKLYNVFNRHSNPNQEAQIVELGKLSREQASRLLSVVQDIEFQVARDDREKLDRAGAKMVHAANALLISAQMIAPSIAEPASQQAMLSSANALSQTSEDLVQAWAPLLSGNEDLIKNVEKERQELEHILEKIRKTCRDVNDDMKNVASVPDVKQEQRLKFVTRLSTATKAVKDTANLIDTITPKMHPSETKEQVQRGLSENIAKLNAALALLLNSASDLEHCNYHGVEEVLKDIEEIMPRIIEDTKKLNVGCDDNARKANLEQLKVMCQSFQGICASAASDDGPDLSDAVSQFANASNKLYYVFRKPTKNEATVNNKVMNLTKSSCGKTSELLTYAQELAEIVGELEGRKLDQAGAQLAEAAGRLLNTAQITSSTMKSSVCREMLLSSVDSLSRKVEDFASTWSPLAASHPDLRGKLQNGNRALEDELRKLREACALAVTDREDKQREQHHENYTKILFATEKRLDEAQKLIHQPLHPVGVEKDIIVVVAMRKKLSQALSKLNAAVAILLNATPEAESIDYEEAESALSVVQKVIPDIITDTKVLNATCDPSTQKENLLQLKDLSDTLREICSSASTPGQENLAEAVMKFANTCGKLYYKFNPRHNSRKEHQIKELAKSTCSKASELLAKTQQLIGLIGGENGEIIDTAGENIAETAKKLLITVQVTAPSIFDAACRRTLLLSADALSHSTEALSSICAPLTSKHKQLVVDIQKEIKELENEVAKLREACSCQESSETDAAQHQRHLQFVAKLSAVEENLQDLDKLINETSTSRPVKGHEAASIQLRLAKSLAQMNAALARFCSSTAVTSKPDYVAAEKSVETIQELLRHMVQDTKTLNVGNNEKVRNADIEDLKAMNEALRGICTSVQFDTPEKLNENTAKLADLSSKLYYIYSPKAEPEKEKQILTTAKSACEKSSKLLVHLEQLLPDMEVSESQVLEQRALQVAETAQAFLTAAQVTAVTISSTECQASLLSSITELSASIAKLTESWSPHVHGKHKSLGDILEDDKRQVESELQKLTEFIKDEKKLEEIYLAETREQEEMKKNEDEFVKAAGDAEKKIKKFGEEMKKLNSTPANLHTKQEYDSALVVKNIELELSKTAVAISAFISCNGSTKINYPNATQFTRELSRSITEVVENVKLLSTTNDDKFRKYLLEDTASLCESTAKLCHSAKTNRENLNESFVESGDKSARLLYTISAEASPAQERQLIAVVQEICNCASNLALGGSKLSSEDSESLQAMLSAGKQTAEAAAKLVYIAKVVAPFIHIPECEKSLTAVCDELIQEIKAYAITWQPLFSSSENTFTIGKLTAESKRLKKLLESFKKDLEAGKMVKRREAENLVIEDTPMRRLATKIMLDAKKLAEYAKTDEERRAFSYYADELEKAIKNVDFINATCKRQPVDASKWTMLTNAINNLQATLLMAHPNKKQEQDNVIDLVTFVKDVSRESEQVIETTANINSGRCKKQVENIKKECHQINLNEFNLLKGNPTSSGCLADHTQEIEDFVKDCEERLERINANVQGIEEENKSRLLEKITRLSESCDQLKFATKSALAAEQGSIFDSIAGKLTDLEKKIDIMLIPTDDGRPCINNKINSTSLLLAKSAIVASAAELGNQMACDDSTVVGPFTKYVTEMKIRTDLRDPDQKKRLLDHLKKLLNLIQSLNAVSNRRVATWQPPDEEEQQAIMDLIIEELDSAQISLDIKPKDTESKVLDDKELCRLLMPPRRLSLGDVTVDKKQLDKKLQTTGTKLSSMTTNVLLSAEKPTALKRSGHATVDAALEFANLALQSGASSESSQEKRIQEATKQMLSAAYTFLTAAEIVSQEPMDTGARRRLLEACRALNEFINKLGRVSSTGSKVQQVCAEAMRSVQVALSTVTSRQPPINGAVYADCQQELTQQGEILENLKDDKPVSKEQFSKSLSYVTAAVCNSTEYAGQCAYLISISDEHKELAINGLVDVQLLLKATNSIRNTLSELLAKAQTKESHSQIEKLDRQVKDLQEIADENIVKMKSSEIKSRLADALKRLENSVRELSANAQDSNGGENKVTAATFKAMEAVSAVEDVVEEEILQPRVENMSAQTQQRCDDVVNNSKDLTNKYLSLLREVKTKEEALDEGEEPMTWVMFNNHRNGVLDAFERLIKSVRDNGQFAGLLKLQHPKEPEDDADVVKKSYLQIHSEKDLEVIVKCKISILVNMRPLYTKDKACDEMYGEMAAHKIWLDLAKKWLKGSVSKVDVKIAGENAVKNILDVGESTQKQLTDNTNKELQELLLETKNLFEECKKKYNVEKASGLVDQLKELKKFIERSLVTRIVEDFIEDEEPLQDLEIFMETETDKTEQKFILEKKIAELLAHLGRVTRTARLVTETGAGGSGLEKETRETELLAPLLVKAAQERVEKPHDKRAVENYKSVLSKYAASLSKVRELCDQAVDPIEFVQTAGETMARLREESGKQQSDPQKCMKTSMAISKLANRVIQVGLSSASARRDPELGRALAAAQQRLTSVAVSRDTRASRLPDWNTTTAEFLRTASEVESVLGGEMIFQKKPEPGQPIYNAALNLHSTLREWSARDNEIVAAAKRCAVLMAKLSEHMNIAKTREVIVTSKSIVTASQEVAQLARTLAAQCTDRRITTSLLQVCDAIPTISGQLKMLTTVKGSSLGRQGNEEDKEAMNMLVGNAQNLMTCIQDVVKSAAAASVKIRSQKGGTRIRWVRKDWV